MGRLPRRTSTGRRRKALLDQRDQLLLASPLAPPRQRRAVERRFVLKEFLAVMDGTGFARTLTFRLRGRLRSCIRPLVQPDPTLTLSNAPLNHLWLCFALRH